MNNASMPPLPFLISGFRLTLFCLRPLCAPYRSLSLSPWCEKGFRSAVLRNVIEKRVVAMDWACKDTEMSFSMQHATALLTFLQTELDS